MYITNYSYGEKDGTGDVYYNMDSPAIIFNSCIIAPVSWSWIAKPILNKLGIDYKKD